MIHPDAMRVLRLQLRLTLLAVLASMPFAAGVAAVPVSVLIGGLCALLPALAYARIAGGVKRAAPTELMHRHYKAEAAKFMLTLTLFAGVFVFFKDLSVAGLFAGYIAATTAYWFGLLSNNRDQGNGK